MTPSNRRVDIADDAKLDLVDIAHYTLEKWGSRQLDEYASALDRTIASLADFPEIGRRRDEIRPGLWSFPAREHVIFYRFDHSSLLVLRFIHRLRSVKTSDF